MAGTRCFFTNTEKKGGSLVIWYADALMPTFLVEGIKFTYIIKATNGIIFKKSIHHTVLHCYSMVNLRHYGMDIVI